MNVLIVDDNPTNLKLLRAILESVGNTVTEAGDGVEAMAKLRHASADVIISDILMPRMDGYQLCMEVRADPQTYGLPFIAYSASYTTANDETMMMDLGADRFLRKPSTPAMISWMVRDVVAAKRRRPVTQDRPKSAAVLLKGCNQRLMNKLEEKRVELGYVLDCISGVAYRLKAVGEQPGRQAMSEQVTAFLGFTIAETMTDGWWRRQLHPDDSAGAIAGLAETWTRGVYRGEYRLRHKDGSLRWVEDHRHVLPGATGEPVEIRGLLVDIHYRDRLADLVEPSAADPSKRAEDLLGLLPAVALVLAGDCSPEKTYHRLLEVTASGLACGLAELWLDEPGGKALRCVANWPRLDTGPDDFLPGGHGPILLRGQELTGRVWASGSVEWCDDLAADAASSRHSSASRLGLNCWFGLPVKLGHEVVGVIGFFSPEPVRTDAALLAFAASVGLQTGGLINRQRVAHQLRQAQKMGTLGQLAAGVAHDFNNILTAIYNHSGLAREAARCTGQPDDSLDFHLAGLMDGARRATILVGRILDYSGGRSEDRRPISLVEIASEAIQLLRAALPCAIEITASLHPFTPAILADATQVHQIVMNLGINAAQAMRAYGGRLTVSVDTCIIDTSLVPIHPDLHSGPHVRLTVSDNGHGMDVTTTALIFEPFFTTKAKGEGTGLGLSMVREIVKAHDAVITVDSQCGEGTTFRVYFPALPAGG